MIKITKRQAREYLFKYQNLSAGGKLVSDDEIAGFIQKVGCIQFDPLNKIARNADLVLQSRCENYTEKTLYRLLYEKRELIDHWDKNMSIWAVTDWPCFSRRRNIYRERFKERAEEFNPVKDEIISKIKTQGCISSKDVFRNQKVEWSWAPTDIGRAVLESMYLSGDLIIHHKEGSRKFYCLPEQVLSESIIGEADPNITKSDFIEWYVDRRIGSIGLLWNRAGDAWLGTGLKADERTKALKRLLDKDKIVEVQIEKIDEIFYIPKESVKILNDVETSKTASLIAPLDNLMWDRKLISAIFDFDYKWEVYTPEKERKYGYYVLPVTYNNSFVGRCEPVNDRQKKELRMENWWWEDGIEADDDMINSLRASISDFMRFLNLEKITVSDSVKKKDSDWMLKCLKS